MGKKVLNIVVNSPSGPKQTCSKARNDDDNIDASDDEGDLDNDGLDHKTNTEELFKVEKERKRNYKQRFCLLRMFMKKTTLTFDPIVVLSFIPEITI